jgi:hypothetical protein
MAGTQERARFLLCRAATAGRPMAAPVFVLMILTRAMPAFTRSRIMLRSKSANAPSL